jgi:hypothetical protein
MASTLPCVRTDSPVDRWSDEPLPLDLGQRDASPSPPSPGKRTSRALLRFLITNCIGVCIGVAGTLAWQSYGDVARQMIAKLASQAAPLMKAASNQVTPAEPATPSDDLQQLKAMSPDLAAVRQSVDQLTAQLQQMEGDVATMQAAQRAILRKVSTPPPPLPPRQAAAPARNAVQN